MTDKFRLAVWFEDFMRTMEFNSVAERSAFADGIATCASEYSNDGCATYLIPEDLGEMSDEKRQHLPTDWFEAKPNA